MKALVIEDDREVAETVSMAFSVRWPECEVELHDTGGAGLRALAGGRVDLVILDVNLPDQEGFSVLEEIRQVSQVPVIMLTVRASEAERVRGLERGADDYVGKPFSPFELVARASAVLRRVGAEATAVAGGAIHGGRLTVNPDTAEVFLDGEEVKVSPTEFRILHMLVQRAGKVVTRDEVLKEVWGMDPVEADTYLLKLHIQHLRRKLGDSGSHPKVILTVRGFGYKVPA